MSYFDLGTYSFHVTTSSQTAQVWFDRGLIWTFGYNHEEAIRCFETALEHDPACAMAHWGIAYAAGPNYNMPWHLFDQLGREAALARAFDATRDAMDNISGISAPELALIAALPARYPQREMIEDPSVWNDDFADAMRGAYRAFADNSDIVSIFAEAIMNRSPWQMWDLATGEPAEGAGTLEAAQVLETAMRDLPVAWAHPGILHLYVHLMEMSPHPEKALRAADVLRTLVPDAGHLIHMPTHIDIQCGNYRDTLYDNQRAIEVDDRYVEMRGAENFYTAYRIHNHHFAIYGAMFLGQYTPAIRAAEALIDTVPEALLRTTSPPMADYMEGYVSMKQHVWIRFGKWAEIIAETLPEDTELYAATTAMMLYAKGVAHSALGQIEEAVAMRKAFLDARSRVPDTRRIHNNTVVGLLGIAEAMLDGELEFRRGNHDAAFAHLREAVRQDDGLPYDEPWGWMQPARHALGALLMECERYEEAEAVYRADLGLDGELSRACQHPENVWSLHGLHECLLRRNEVREIVDIGRRLSIAMARCDVPITASCFCRNSVARKPLVRNNVG